VDDIAMILLFPVGLTTLLVFDTWLPSLVLAIVAIFCSDEWLDIIYRKRKPKPDPKPTPLVPQAPGLPPLGLSARDWRLYGHYQAQPEATGIAEKSEELVTEVDLETYLTEGETSEADHAPEDES
jgi:hypothetical protein